MIKSSCSVVNYLRILLLKICQNLPYLAVLFRCMSLPSLFLQNNFFVCTKLGVQTTLKSVVHLIFIDLSASYLSNGNKKHSMRKISFRTHMHGFEKIASALKEKKAKNLNGDHFGWKINCLECPNKENGALLVFDDFNP